MSESDALAGLIKTILNSLASENVGTTTGSATATAATTTTTATPTVIASIPATAAAAPAPPPAAPPAAPPAVAATTPTVIASIPAPPTAAPAPAAPAPAAPPVHTTATTAHVPTAAPVHIPAASPPANRLRTASSSSSSSSSTTPQKAADPSKFTIKPSTPINPDSGHGTIKLSIPAKPLPQPQQSSPPPPPPSIEDDEPDNVAAAASKTINDKAPKNKSGSIKASVSEKLLSEEEKRQIALSEAASLAEFEQSNDDDVKNYGLVNVEGDGNCFYYALYQALHEEGLFSNINTSLITFNTEKEFVHEMRKKVSENEVVVRGFRETIKDLCDPKIDPATKTIKLNQFSHEHQVVINKFLAHLHTLHLDTVVDPEQIKKAKRNLKMELLKASATDKVYVSEIEVLTVKDLLRENGVILTIHVAKENPVELNNPNQIFLYTNDNHYKWYSKELVSIAADENKRLHEYNSGLKKAVEDAQKKSSAKPFKYDEDDASSLNLQGENRGFFSFFSVNNTHFDNNLEPQETDIIDAANNIVVADIIRNETGDTDIGLNTLQRDDKGKYGNCFYYTLYKELNEQSVLELIKNNLNIDTLTGSSFAISMRRLMFKNRNLHNKFREFIKKVCESEDDSDLDNYLSLEYKTLIKRFLNKQNCTNNQQELINGFITLSGTDNVYVSPIEVDAIKELLAPYVTLEITKNKEKQDFHDGSIPKVVLYVDRHHYKSYSKVLTKARSVAQGYLNHVSSKNSGQSDAAAAAAAAAAERARIEQERIEQERIEQERIEQEKNAAQAKRDADAAAAAAEKSKLEEKQANAERERKIELLQKAIQEQLDASKAAILAAAEKNVEKIRLATIAKEKADHDRETAEKEQHKAVAAAAAAAAAATKQQAKSEQKQREREETAQRNAETTAQRKLEFEKKKAEKAEKATAAAKRDQIRKETAAAIAEEKKKKSTHPSTQSNTKDGAQNKPPNLTLRFQSPPAQPPLPVTGEWKDPGIGSLSFYHSLYDALKHQNLLGIFCEKLRILNNNNRDYFTEELPKIMIKKNKRQYNKQTPIDQTKNTVLINAVVTPDISIVMKKDSDINNKSFEYIPNQVIIFRNNRNQYQWFSFNDAVPAPEPPVAAASSLLQDASFTGDVVPDEANITDPSDNDNEHSGWKRVNLPGISFYNCLHQALSSKELLDKFVELNQIAIEGDSTNKEVFTRATRLKIGLDPDSTIIQNGEEEKLISENAAGGGGIDITIIRDESRVDFENKNSKVILLDTGKKFSNGDKRYKWFSFNYQPPQLNTSILGRIGRMLGNLGGKKSKRNKIPKSKETRRNKKFKKLKKSNKPKKSIQPKKRKTKKH